MEKSLLDLLLSEQKIANKVNGANEGASCFNEKLELELTEARKQIAAHLKMIMGKDV